MICHLGWLFRYSVNSLWQVLRLFTLTFFQRNQLLHYVFFNTQNRWYAYFFNRNKTPQNKLIKKGLLGVIFHSELAEKAIRTEPTNLTENITFPDLLRIKLNQLNAIYNGNYQISGRNIFHISQLLPVFAATVEINALTPTSVITNYNWEKIFKFDCQMDENYASL